MSMSVVIATYKCIYEFFLTPFNIKKGHTMAKLDLKCLQRMPQLTQPPRFSDLRLQRWSTCQQDFNMNITQKPAQAELFVYII